MTKSTASAKALKEPDIARVVSMECLGNTADLVRVNIYLSDILILEDSVRKELEEESSIFIRRLYGTLSR